MGGNSTESGILKEQAKREENIAVSFVWSIPLTSCDGFNSMVSYKSALSTLLFTWS